jgi:hypothetical protein
MLAADRRLLRASVEQRRLEIKNIEIGHYTSNLDMITQQGALVGGFSMGALAGVGGESSPWHTIYCQSLTASVCFNIASVIICTFCSISGPKMALLGPEGSPFEACRKLRTAHLIASALNTGGMATFFIALLDMGFYLFNRGSSFSMAIQLAFGTSFVVYTVFRLKENFSFVPNKDLETDYRDNAPDWTTQGKNQAAFKGAPTIEHENEMRTLHGDQKAMAVIKAGFHRIKLKNKWKVKYFELYRDFLVYYESQDGIMSAKLNLYGETQHDAYVGVLFPADLKPSDRSHYKTATFGLECLIGATKLRFDFATKQEQSDWAEAIHYCAEEAGHAASLRAGGQGRSETGASSNRDSRDEGLVYRRPPADTL